MVCPNCSTKYDRGIICPNCKVDSVLYKGIMRISNAMYNKGLAYAKVSNLSGALDCLEKSVQYNKKNVQARNLLGLIQYEIGLTGEALKNWVISCGFLKTDNPALEYIELFQKDTVTLESYNDAIRIYNFALGDVVKNIDDMAVVKLKQVLELNPKFIDALNLLTFCYLIKGDKAKAAVITERVLALDTGNVVALNYYKEVHPSADASVANRQVNKKNVANAQNVKTYKQVPINNTLNNGRSKNFHLAEIMCLIIGVVCTIGVMSVLVFPALENNRNSQVEATLARLTQLEQTHDNLIAEKEQTIDQLQEQVTEQEESIQNWEIRYDTLERTFQILNAFELLRDERMQEAVNALGTIEADGLAPDIAERVSEIRFTAYPVLARERFNEGLTAYNAVDYETARNLFERAWRYTEYMDDPAFEGEILYYLAYTYSHGIDIERAIEHFERLIEEFPNHNRISPSRGRLSQIS